MKKRVEAELISIAHRILKLKNKSEVDQLYKETQKLYEALTILKFYGDNYEMVKQTVSPEDLDEKLTVFIEEKKLDVFEEPIPVNVEVENLSKNSETEETEVIPAIEVSIDENDETLEDESFEDNDADEAIDIEDLVGETVDQADFNPAFELSFEEEKAEAKTPGIDQNEVKKEKKQATLEEIFADHYKEPVFVKPEKNNGGDKKTVQIEVEKEKNSSLNDALSSTISIGLNDRIGFIKHLFNNSNEDYNRVVSQLNTFDTFSEAKQFLDEMVIPDYNYWVGKEEYLERFMEAIEKKFK